MKATSKATEPVVSITRDYDAPRELVFAAWSDPAHLNRWFAPNGCTVECQLDFRVGGAIKTLIRHPQFGACECQGAYLEIVKPERIVYSLLSPEHCLKDGWPSETIVTVTLTEARGKTTLTLQQTVPLELAKRTGAYPSWLEMLDRLVAELKLMA